MKFTPEDWKQKLGDHIYAKNLHTIIDLVLIWSFFENITEPTPYEEYLEFKAQQQDAIAKSFASVLLSHKSKTTGPIC